LVVGAGAGWCVVVAGAGTAGAVVAGAVVAGAGVGLFEVASGVGDSDAAFNSPAVAVPVAVAVAAGVLVFGLPPPTAAAIAPPPQHSTRMMARIPRTSGLLDFFTAVGTAWAGIWPVSGS
jgi:hypothetical protein